MSLFFDGTWFDARLHALGLSKIDLATALGLTSSQIDEMWKDQREVGVGELRVIAALLGVSPAEVAERAGVSTPLPPDGNPDIAAVLERLDRIEKMLSEIKTSIRALADRRPTR